MDNIRVNTLIKNSKGKTVKDFIDESFLLFDANYKSIPKIEISENNIELPDCYDKVILSLILWCSYSLSSKLNDMSQFYDKQIYDKFSALRQAILADIIIKNEHLQLEKKRRKEKVTFRFNWTEVNRITPQSALINPLQEAFSKDSNHTMANKNFSAVCSQLGLDFFNQIYPAIFIIWLTTYSPSKNKHNIVISTDTRSNILIATLLGNITNQKQYKSKFNTRIKNKIMHDLEKKVRPDENCKRMYEYIHGNCCNEKCKGKDKAIFNCIDKLGIQISSKIAGEDNKVLISDLINYNDLTLNQKSTKELSKDSYLEKQTVPPAFWKSLYVFAEEKYIELVNLKEFKKLFEDATFLSIGKEREYKASKPFSMIYLNIRTRWIDLLLLNKGLPFNAIHIKGIHTKQILADLCNLKIGKSIHSYAEANYLDYKDDYSRVFDLLSGDFLEPKFINTLNRIIKITSHNLRNKVVDQKIKDSYYTRYETLFDELLKETNLEGISATKLVRLAEKEYWDEYE